MFLVLSTGSAAGVAVTTRCIAKAIDVGVIVVMSIVLPSPAGVFLGFLYMLVHDGLFRGQSPGKRICGLRVVHIKNDAPCTIRESAIRNAPLGVATFFAIIPFWGWIVAILLGIPLVALEMYLMLRLEGGGRLGDVMADTRVVEVERKKSLR